MIDRPLSLAALSVLELSPPEMVDVAAQAGYDHVGLRLVPATADEPSWPVVGDTPMVDAIARRLASTGMTTLDIEIFRLKPATVVADFERALATGARLGARFALVAGNDPDEARTVERFAAFCDLAARYAIGASLEPMPWTDVRDVVQAARIVAAAARPNGGVLVDPIHFDRAGNVPSDLAAIPASRLRYAQLCDAPAERPRDPDTLLLQARGERLPPGEGGLDLTGLLRALPPDVPLSLEVPMRTRARTMPALERARAIRAATLALLDRLDR